MNQHPDRPYSERDYHPAASVSVRCAGVYFYRFCVGSTPNELKDFLAQAHAYIDWRFGSDHKLPPPPRPISGETATLRRLGAIR